VKALILHNCRAGRPWQIAEPFEEMAESSWDEFLYNFSAAQNVLPNRDTSDAQMGLSREDFLTILHASRSSPPFEEVAARLTVPTLVTVSSDVPGALDDGRRLASAIPNGTLVAVPAWGRDLVGTANQPPAIVSIVEEFLQGLGPAETVPAAAAGDGATRARLTQREAEVLRLVVAGKSNSEIATQLVLSVRTVERHISNVYVKIGAHGRADAVAYAFHHGLA
jgi:DNA-binding CsgD family transcriptional regulator